MSALPREVSGVVRYPARLTQAWEAHRAPRAAGAPTVVSLFAGGGGSSLGYSMAGYAERLAVEWDNHAADIFRINFPDVPMYHGDIAALSGEMALQLSGLEPRQLTVLDGSPPCQGFSTAGNRHLSDSRNQLFREYVSLLRVFQPLALVMENVSGMVRGKMRLIFADIMRELKSCGYLVSCRLMSAKYFGVPQDRSRVIFIGVRDDLGITPSHPPAQRGIVTLRQALHELQNTPEQIAASCYPEGHSCHALLQVMKAGEQGSKYHPKGHHFGLARLTWDAPSRTVLKQDGSGQSCGTCHPTELRRLTIPEVRRVCSFPDQFQLRGSTAEQWARMGNSVPPLFMRAIAAHIRATLRV